MPAGARAEEGEEELFGELALELLLNFDGDLEGEDKLALVELAVEVPALVEPLGVLGEDLEVLEELAPEVPLAH